MMLLDVPFIPDDCYVQFLNDHSDALHSLHFSLFAEESLDARHMVDQGCAQQVLESLSQVRGPKKYALLNSRFYHPQRYFDANALKAVIETLAELHKRSCLDGVVFADFYLLRALSRADQDIAAQLEAVPSINCMMDSFDKITTLFEAIASTHFRQPQKIILDRSLNRKIGALSEISKKCRQAYPEMRLGLLANEGCLYQCPFKQAHDAHIALANMGNVLDNTFSMNRDLGCVQVLNDNPQYLFKSPFIRPEDAERYREYVALIKICGRTLGPEFLMKTITAYCNKSFAGNLLELTDTMEWLAQRLYVANDRLPDIFFDTVTTCPKDCTDCSYCRTLLDSTSSGLPLAIADLRT